MKHKNYTRTCVNAIIQSSQGEERISRVCACSYVFWWGAAGVLGFFLFFFKFLCGIYVFSLPPYDAQ